MKIFLAILGCAAFVLGVVGIFVPLLPTTPFLLLAAWAFCRSSPRLYDRLLAHPCLGAYVRNFREYRAIPLRAKIISVTLIWATLLYCIFGVVRAWWWAQAGLLLLAVGLTWHILSYATLRRAGLAGGPQPLRGRNRRLSGKSNGRNLPKKVPPVRFRSFQR